uniref:Uncharacterized protein n=1 Tax=Arundo donax TaxID=35708 RepID=A0A0A9HND7_ARUDO
MPLQAAGAAPQYHHPAAHYTGTVLGVTHGHGHQPLPQTAEAHQVPTALGVATEQDVMPPQYHHPAAHYAGTVLGSAHGHGHQPLLQQMAAAHQVGAAREMSHAVPGSSSGVALGSPEAGHSSSSNSSSSRRPRRKRRCS